MAIDGLVIELGLVIHVHESESLCMHELPCPIARVDPPTHIVCQFFLHPLHVLSHKQITNSSSRPLEHTNTAGHDRSSMEVSIYHSRYFIGIQPHKPVIIGCPASRLFQKPNRTLLSALPF